MSLLDFARGPALEVALAIFLFGLFWRLVHLVFLPWQVDRSIAKRGAPPRAVGAARGIFGYFWPYKNFWLSSAFQALNGYVFHFGLAIVVFGFGPHIAFFKGLTGLSWPNLPTRLVTIIAVVTLASLAAALTRRLVHPVQRLLSTADDYLSWLFTTVPVLTGLAATAHLGARYETLLAVHLLSVAAFLIWLPFGRLMHAFIFLFARGNTGAAQSHRGVKI